MLSVIALWEATKTSRVYTYSMPVRSVLPNSNKKIVDILDGLHRLSKSVITQQTHILVSFASPTDVKMSTIKESTIDGTQ